GAAGAATGPEVDVSNAAGVQSEVSVAVDPLNPLILVAGSNSSLVRLMRVYGSVDGGASWTSESGPPLPRRRHRGCAAGDPAVGIDTSGRQYFGFLVVRPCSPIGRASLYVATRGGPEGAWRTSSLRVAAGGVFDDKPTLTVDTSRGSPHRGRVYVAWSRFSGGGSDSIVISHSDDGGRRWSEPVEVNDVPGSV